MFRRPCIVALISRRIEQRTLPPYVACEQPAASPTPARTRSKNVCVQLYNPITPTLDLTLKTLYVLFWMLPRYLTVDAVWTPSVECKQRNRCLMFSQEGFMGPYGHLMRVSRTSRGPDEGRMRHSSGAREVLMRNTFERSRVLRRCVDIQRNKQAYCGGPKLMSYP